MTQILSKQVNHPKLYQLYLECKLPSTFDQRDVDELLKAYVDQVSREQWQASKQADKDKLAAMATAITAYGKTWNLQDAVDAYHETLHQPADAQELPLAIKEDIEHAIRFCHPAAAGDTGIAGRLAAFINCGQHTDAQELIRELRGSTNAVMTELWWCAVQLKLDWKDAEWRSRSSAGRAYDQAKIACDKANTYLGEQP